LIALLTFNLELAGLARPRGYDNRCHPRYESVVILTYLAYVSKLKTFPSFIINSDRMRELIFINI
jgi:hypothetical protein